MRPSSQNDRTVDGKRGSPATVLAAVWLAALILSLYGASGIRAWIVRDRWFGARPWALAAADSLVGVARLTRLTRAHQSIDTLVSRVTPDAVWLRKAPRPRPGTRSATTIVKKREAASAEKSRAPLLARTERVRRALLIGESSMQFYLGSELERLLTSFYRDLEVMRFGKLATGLTRPDVLNWPEKARALLDEFRPDLVIANFGGNDAQNILLDNGAIVRYGAPAWDREYAARVGAVADLVKARGARMVMIGMPIMRDRGFSRRMEKINRITRAEMAKVGAVFIPTWDLTTDTSGAYRQAVKVDGERGLMRLADGKHYSRLGGKFVARRIAERLERYVVLEPKASELAIAFRRDIASRALGRTASYLAYVPQEAATGGRSLPVLYLLHGTGGSWQDWPEHAHRQLQELSARHSLIIVTPDGGANGWYLDSERVPDSKYETHLVEEVLADVDSYFPSDRRRAIGGLSAGGHGAITLALKHPSVFRCASSMSGALDLTEAHNRPALRALLGPYRDAPEAWKRHSAHHLVARLAETARRIPMLVTVGSSDRWAPANRAFRTRLSELGIEVQFEERPGRHDWKYWLSELPKHVAWHADHLAAAVNSRPLLPRRSAR